MGEDLGHLVDPFIQAAIEVGPLLGEWAVQAEDYVILVEGQRLAFRKVRFQGACPRDLALVPIDELIHGLPGAILSITLQFLVVMLDHPAHISFHLLLGRVAAPCVAIGCQSKGIIAEQRRAPPLSCLPSGR